jgi:hypothetical protein
VADAGSWVLGSWIPFWLHLSCNFYRNIVLPFLHFLDYSHFQMATLTDTSRSFTVPGNPRMHLNLQTSSTTKSPKKPWQSRRPPSFRSSKSQTRRDPETDRLSREISRQSTASQKRTPKWWKIRLFRGMIDDVKRRLPYYWSDWRDAWDYRVIPATVYMYFAKYDYTFFMLPHQIPWGQKVVLLLSMTIHIS